MGVEIEGAKDFYSYLDKELDSLKREGEISYTTGFTQNYAVYVHEMEDLNHEVGEAKFLEKAVARTAAEVGRIVTNAVLQGSSFKQGLYMGALRIQREAMLRVPIDTGALRASAFTAIAADVERVSMAAYQKAERLRDRVYERRRQKAIKARERRKKRKKRKKS